VVKKILKFLKGGASVEGLDSPSASVAHSKLIRQKRFLREIYEETYGFFRENLPAENGTILELGSGGGFIKQKLPNAISSDVVVLPGADVVLSGLTLPLRNASLSGVVMMNVFHHLPDVRSFFRECSRTLTTGGKVLMVEPANTAWGRFVYKHLHHEPFEPDQESWELEERGRMTTANDALPWIVFCRDRDKFEKEFPDLKIDFVTPYMPIRYLLSGGVSFPQLLPSFCYPIINTLEKSFSRLHKYLGMFMKISITKVG